MQGNAAARSFFVAIAVDNCQARHGQARRGDLADKNLSLRAKICHCTRKAGANFLDCVS